ncbi:MAG: glycosyltransferase family 4 protein [Patescibacteria group bacterium]
MKKLKIAQIAPLWIPVPPRTYGGIELMVNNLTLGLRSHGHDVTVFASGDSTIPGPLISPTDKALWLQKDARNPHATIIKMLAMIKELGKEFDIIHNHFNFFMFPLALMGDMPPILTSIRSPLDKLYADTIKMFPQINFVTISNDAKVAASDFGIEVKDVVYNGIDIEKYPFNPQHSDYLLYLSRINRGKGIITAIKVAKSLGKKLIIAGNIVGFNEWNYFMQEVQPYLNDSEIKFVGQANFNEKIELMKNAYAFLFPIEVREAFGNVMIEAMACGTPVIAFNRGSVSEIIEHGKTGFIVNSEEEMISSVSRIDSIDRMACRKAVEEKFTLDHMVNNYERVYENIVQK